jgi:hypothetical protein
MATRNHKFCRHHGAPSRPKTLPTGDRPWSRIACWRDLGRVLPEYPKQEIPGELLQILYALLDAQISDRTAGRILRGLLQRYGSVPLISEHEASPASAHPSAGLGDADLNRLLAQLLPAK